MKLIVVGGTAAGLSAASKAKRLDSSIEIEVYEKSGFISYGACGLPYFVGDLIDAPEDLVSLTLEDTEKRGIPTKIHHEVEKIDREMKTVTVRDLDSGDVLIRPYDKLVLATGAVPVRPRGLDGKLYFLRTVEDGIDLKLRAHGAKSAVIIGAGLIGLELAEELTGLGLEVTVIEAGGKLLPALPESYSAQVLGTLNSHGVKVMLSTTVEEIVEGEAVVTSGGERVSADFVVAATGVRPNSKLAEDAGLELGLKGAIKVDDHMRTSDHDIYAAGDCIEVRNIVTGKAAYVPLGTTANKTGRVAGSNIGGEDAVFEGILGSQVTKVFDTYIAQTGITKAEWDNAEETSITKGDRASYYPGGAKNSINLVFDKSTGRLLGAQAIGSETVAGRVNALACCITAGMTVKDLNGIDFVYSPSVAPVYDPLLIAASQAMKKVR